MKVLYIGHYREGTGWGNAALNYIQALIAADIDVVCRYIKFNNANPDIPEVVKEAESKSSAGVDVCIQNVLPHLIEYNGRFKKNIGIYFTESQSIKYSSWPARLNLMDELWVCCNEMVQVAKNSGVDTPCHVVPLPVNLARYQQKVQPKYLPDGNSFRFYFVGEMNKRKNIPALLQAFHTEFDHNEPVSLILKLNAPDISVEQLQQKITQICSLVHDKTRLYINPNSYHSEIVFAYHMSDRELLSLHEACDCFVNTSFGESWSLPSIDAMAMGNLVISTPVGGPLDYLKDVGLFTKGNMTPVFGSDPLFQDLATARENWFQVDICSLREQMRIAYEMSDKDRLNISKRSKENAYNYSYEVVGKQMKGLLND